MSVEWKAFDLPFLALVSEVRTPGTVSDQDLEYAYPDLQENLRSL